MSAQIIDLSSRRSPPVDVIGMLGALKMAFCSAGLESPQASLDHWHAKDGSEPGEYFGYADDVDTVITQITVGDFARAKQSLAAIAARFDEAAELHGQQPRRCFSFSVVTPRDKAAQLRDSAEKLRLVLNQLQVK